MSKEQRAKVDTKLRQPRPQGGGSVEELRAGFQRTMAAMLVPKGIRTSATTLGARPALLVEAVEPVANRARPGASPADRRAGTILYFHGGGFVIGSPETALSLTGNLVVKTGIRALSLDYRLAPEHPFPAATEDAIGAYRALLEGGEHPSTIAFAGDSAGGGLCVSTCLLAREADLPMPAAIVAFSPAVDATLAGESVDTKAGIDPIFTRQSLEHVTALYLDGKDPNQPLLSPAVRADLSGFPPMLLQAGANELLLDDATRLAVRARNAGVDVILDITAAVPHVFQSFVGVLDEADEALDRAALFLSQRMR